MTPPAMTLQDHLRSETEGPAHKPSSSSAVNDRLSHLFRVSLKDGRIHPLYLPVLKYRQVQRSA